MKGNPICFDTGKFVDLFRRCFFCLGAFSFFLLLFLHAIAPPNQEQKSAPERERGERSLVFHPAGLAKGTKKKEEEKEEAQQHTHTPPYWRLIRADGSAKITPEIPLLPRC
jgi:hypothetical protein